MSPRSWNPAAVRPGDAIPKDRGKSAIAEVPLATLSLLISAGVAYMQAGWIEYSEVLKLHDKEQHDEGGMQPRHLIAKFRARLGVSRATAYRYIAKFDELGLGDRLPVEGTPRRGPGTMVRYILRHTTWRTWAEKLADDARKAARRRRRPASDSPPPAAPRPADAVERAPPPPQVLEQLERMRANLTT